MTSLGYVTLVAANIWNYHAATIREYAASQVERRGILDDRAIADDLGIMTVIAR